MPFEERFNGYNGVARMRYGGSVSPFVPAVSGLNCEYIFDDREPDYETRWKKMEAWEAQESRIEQLSPAAEVRFSFAAGGGGPGCPAWDYQAVVAHPQAGRRYGFRQRVVYKPFESLQEAERLHDEWDAG